MAERVRSFVIETDHKINLENLKSCRMSSNFMYIGFLYTNLNFHIFMIGKKYLLPNCKNVLDFFWRDELDEPISASQFIVHYENGDIITYQINLKSSLFDEVHSIKCSHISALLTEHDADYHYSSELQFLGFSKDVVIFTLDKTKVISFDINRRHVVKVLSLSLFVEKYISIHLCLENLILLTEEQIKIISLLGNSLIKQVAFKDVLCTLELTETAFTPMMFSVTIDGKMIIVASREGYVLRFEIAEKEDSEIFFRTYSVNTMEQNLLCLSRINSSQGTCLQNANVVSDHLISGKTNEKNDSLWEKRLNLFGKKVFQTQSCKDVVSLEEASNRKSSTFLLNLPIENATISGIHSKICYASLCYDVIDSHERHTSIKVMDLYSGIELITYDFNEPHVFVEGAYLNHPDIIISKSRILMMVQNISEEKLINKFISYSSATIADSLSTMNNWQDINLPLPILSSGLKNHQLDTVSFFLKSRSSALIFMLQQETLLETDLVDHINEVTSISEMILVVVEENLTKNNSVVFAKQLIKIIMNYLNGILRQIYDSQQFSSCSRNHLTDTVMKFLIKFRGFLSTLMIPCDVEDVSQSLTFITTVNKCKIPEEWKIMNNSAVIGDAVVKRLIPTYQMFMKDDDFKKSSLDLISFEAKNVLIDCLCKEDFPLAFKIIKQLGLNVNTTVYNLCITTINSILQTSLIHYLNIHGMFTEVDLQAVHNLHLIKKTFPCSSFTRSLELIKNDSFFKNWKHYENHTDTFSKLKVLEVIKEPVMVISETNSSDSQDNWEKVQYSNLSLEWLKNMAPIQVEFILIEGFLSIKNADIADFFHHHSNPMAVWLYCLNSNHDNWLIKGLSESKNKISECGSLLDTHITLKNFEACSPYVREKIIQEMCRLGNFSFFSDFTIPKFIYLMQDLSYEDDSMLFPMSFLKNKGLEFSRLLVDYLLEHNLFNVIYEYIENFNTNEIIDETYPSWFSFLMKIRLIENHEFSSNLILECSLDNLQNLRSKGVNFYEKEHLAVLASIVFSHGGFHSLSLDQASNELNIDLLPNNEILPLDVLCQALNSYTHVKSSIYPQRKEDIIKEVTFYELLKDHWAFDWRKKWFPANGEPLKDIPNFSHCELMKTFGHHCELNFLYYLKLGRPTYAYVKCFTQEIIHKKMTYSKRLNISCSLASGLGLKNFFEVSTAAAAVAFIELQGKNSLWLRLNLAALHLIKCNIVETKISFNNETVDHKDEKMEYLQFLINGISRNNMVIMKQLLDSLEKSVKNNCCSTTKYSVVPLLEWKIPLTFRYFHQLELNSDFLVSCAESSNWIMFTIFSQYYHFPLEQILAALLKFKNPIIREHLKNSFFHLCYQHPKSFHQSLKKKQSYFLSGDTRYKLYDKIGLSKTYRGDQETLESQHMKDQMETDNSLSDKEIILDALSNSLDSDFMLNNSVLDDFFGLLLKSQEISSSSRSLLVNSFHLENPVLTIVSSCTGLTENPESLPLEQLCVWLTISSDPVSKSKMLSAVSRAIDSHTWIIDDLLTMLKTAIQMHNFSLIAQGFYLFQKDSPLYHLFLFLENFFEKREQEKGAQYLQMFIETLIKFQQNILDSSNIIGDSAWIEKASYCMISESIIACNRSHDILSFLKLLIENNISQVYTTTETPNFPLLLQLHCCILDEKIHFPYEDFLKKPHKAAFNNNCSHLLETLLEKRLYNIAFSFAEILDLEKHTVIISQLNDEFCKCQDSKQWQLPNVRLEFWLRCLRQFQMSEVSPEHIHKFFKDHITDALSYSEKFLLFKLCLSHWNETVNADKFNLEIEMWKSRINAETNLEFTGVDEYQFVEAAIRLSTVSQVLQLKKEIILEGQLNLSPPSCHFSLTEDMEVLKRIIQQELDGDNISQAYYISQLFSVEERNLDILLLCMDLAEGRMVLNDIHSKIIFYSKESSCRKQKTPFSSLVKKCLYDNDPNSDRHSEDLPITTVLSALFTLCSHCIHGINYCSMIFIYYWIATILDLDYHFVVQHLKDFETFEILRKVLKCKYEHKYILSREFIRIKKVCQRKVAHFLTEEFIQKLKTALYGNDMGFQFIWNDEELKYFNELTSLCDDPTLLGQHLLDASNSLQSTSVENKRSFLLDIELFIKAHECFSRACNTEGIAQVLQKTKNLIKKLIDAEEFSSIIHLLCGIGRFNEMLYIFDILLDHHQFELLLKKGVEKSNHLKQALVNYMTYYHPLDKEMFTMIAFRFRLCRDIGEMHEEIALKKLKELNCQHLSKSNTEQLKCILQYFVDAAENFLKSNCEQRATQCANMAQLIALQIFLLPTGEKIINLTQKEVQDFIVFHRCFPQALLVSQAYNEQWRWDFALYENVIVRGDVKYLEDFHAHLGLTENLIESIAYQIQRENASAGFSNQNFRKMLNLLPDKGYKLKIAKQFGIGDFANEINKTLFLKDVGLKFK